MEAEDMKLQNYAQHLSQRNMLQIKVELADHTFVSTC